MNPNLYAILLLSMPAFTLVVILFAGKRPTIRSVVMAFIYFSVALFSTIKFLPLIGGWSRAALLPILLGAGMGSLIFAFVPQRIIRLILLALLLLGGRYLTSAYLHMVESPDYHFSKTPPAELEEKSMKQLRMARTVIASIAEEEYALVMPEGWLEDALYDASSGTIRIMAFGSESGVVTPCWHSRFTSIYRLRSISNGIWCAGGPVKDSAEHLEIRLRKKYEINP